MTKNVLITGAAKGLGRALVNEFHDRGHRVFALDIDIESLENYRENERVKYFQVNVSDIRSVRNFYHDLTRITDHIDILINNAGITDFFPLSECPPEDTRKIFDVNTFGPLNMIHGLLPILLKSKGLIINISSVSCNFPMAFQPYQPSKIALEAIHKTVRQELMVKGIRMVLIRAGAIETSFLDHTRKMNSPADIPVFKNNFLKFKKLAGSYIGRTVAPGDVARKIYRISGKKRLKYVYRANYNPLFSLFGILPQRWLDNFIAKKIKD